MTDREIALEQALIAVFGALKESGADVESIAKNSCALIIGNSRYRIVEHPHVTEACTEIEKASQIEK